MFETIIEGGGWSAAPWIGFGGAEERQLRCWLKNVVGSPVEGMDSSDNH